MDDKQLRQLRVIIREEVGSIVEEKVGSIVEEKVGSIVEEKVGPLIDKKIAASEERILKGVDERFEAFEKRLVTEIGDFIDQTILPQLEAKADKTDIDRIERKLDRSLAKDLEQDHRLDRIESLPTVAHELKLKKR